jgi:creatinine amidohydrolase
VGITTPVLRSLAIDLGRGFYRQGLRNVIFISGHAGKTHTLTLVDAGEALTEELDDIAVAVVSEYNEVLKAGAGIYETADDSHAGEVETSRIMHLHPDLVDGTADEEYPSFPPHLIVRDKTRFWPGGVWGDPAKASPEKGELLMEKAVENLVVIIRRLEAEASGP